MKTNPALQRTLNFSNPAQVAYYSAHVLSAGLLNSPSTPVQAAVPGVAAVPTIVAQPAHPAYPARAAVPANLNTGYGFGELYLNSPAYPRLTAIPAISPKAATAAVVGRVGTPAVAPIPAIVVPAVQALPGWADAIDITKTESLVTITAQLPVAKNVGLVGSSKTFIGEITPSALQATAWLDEKANTQDAGFNLADASIPILEQLFYKNALECEHTVTDTVRVVNGVSMPCKTIVVKLYPLSGFDPLSNSLQLPIFRPYGVQGS
jgi:hypothetical protein